MDARLLRGLLAALAVATALHGHAEAGTPACEVPAASADPFRDRAGLLAAYERLPRACLQQIFSSCQLAASRSLMDLASAAVCSFGYEALLSQQFGGDFHELLAWWQAQQPRNID